MSFSHGRLPQEDEWWNCNKSNFFYISLFHIHRHQNKVCMMKKELKLNDQIWIDYKANNEVSSGKHSKGIIVWVFKSVPLSIFHYIIQGSLCSQRDHEKVMLKTQVSRITLLVPVQWDWGQGLWPPNMHLHVTMSHNTTGGGVEVFKVVWRNAPLLASWVTLLKN